jgi:spore coat protein U-like protein
MTIRKLLAVSIAAAAVGLGASGLARAATAQANLNVSATVAANCTISTGNVAFGIYDPIVVNATAALQRAGSVTVACTRGTAPNVGLDLGKSNTGTTRRMSDGASNFLPYELYVPTSNTPAAACAYSTVWGNAAGNWFALSAAPSFASRTYNVCGQIAGGIDVPAGTYNDIVVATVNF